MIAGGCTEDCSYCSQSSRYATTTKASRLVQIEPVIEAARKAKANGSTRFCMGAAWRGLEGKKSGFEKILKMVSEVRGMGMEGWSDLNAQTVLTGNQFALPSACSLLNKLVNSRMQD
jgi:biotin synthase-like enzyme